VPTDIAKISDHEQRALDFRVSWLKTDDATTLETVISVLGDEIQQLEDVTHDLVAERLLETADGVQLDAYGKVLGLARNGLDDETYRAVLLVVVRANRASGTIPVIIDVVETLLTAHLSLPVVYTPLHPACYSVSWVIDTATGDVDAGLLSALVQLQTDMRPAGVCLELSQGVSVAPEGNYFGFDHDTNSLGFDDVGGNGGYLNGRPLWPEPLTFPFPEAGQGGVWATTDLNEFSSNLGNLDGLEVTAWGPSVDSESATDLVPASGETGPDYARLAGHVERGALEFAGDVYVLPSTAYFPSDGLCGFHFRVKANGATKFYLLASKDPADDSEDAAIGWDPVVGWFYEEAGTIVCSQGSGSTDWHTVALTGDGADWFLFVDRLQVDTASVSTLPGANAAALGARSDTNGSYDGPAFAEYADCDLAVFAAFQAFQSVQDRDDTWDAIDAIDGVLVAASSLVDELGNTLVDEFGTPIVTE
jgi:hypothetical protein